MKVKPIFVVLLPKTNELLTTGDLERIKDNVCEDLNNEYHVLVIISLVNKDVSFSCYNNTNEVSIEELDAIETLINKKS